MDTSVWFRPLRGYCAMGVIGCTDNLFLTLSSGRRSISEHESVNGVEIVGREPGQDKKKKRKKKKTD